jgi:hypothetical protein
MGQFNQFAQDWSGTVVEPDVFGYHVVPEPGVLSLLGLGLAGVGFMRWRKKS